MLCQGPVLAHLRQYWPEGDAIFTDNFFFHNIFFLTVLKFVFKYVAAVADFLNDVVLCHVRFSVIGNRRGKLNELTTFVV